MKIEAKQRYVDSVSVKRYLKDYRGLDINKMSGKEVVDELFGCYEDGYRGDFRIVDDNWEPQTKWWHRLNRFWAYPLTFACAPYQYIVHGQVGWSDKTRFGSFLLRITGYR